jgi:hypothetical protein
VTASDAPRFAFVLSLAAAVGGCQTESKPIPVMSVIQYEALPPGQKPIMFRDPDPLLAFPYNIHETDGLSRNPNDCARWGCVDNADR